MGIFNKRQIEAKSVTTAIQSFFQRMSITMPDDDSMYATLNAVAKHNVWVAGSIRAIVQSFIRPEYRFYNVKSKEQIDVDSGAFVDLLDSPNPYQRKSAFMQYLAFSYQFYGNAYIRKIRVGNTIKGLMPLHVNSVDVVRRPDGSGIDYYHTISGVRTLIPVADIWHWKDSTFTDSMLVGESKLQNLLYSLTSDNLVSRYNMAVIKNDGHPSGILSSDQGLSQEKAEAAEKAWMKKFADPDNKGRVAVLGNGVKYQNVGGTIKDMAFEVLKKITKEEVFSIFQVPPVMLGQTESVNYANAHDQRKIFWELNMQPCINSFLGKWNELSEEIQPDVELYADYTGIQELQDLLSKKDLFYIGQSLGVSADEMIDKLELPFDKDSIIDEEPMPEAEEPVKAIKSIIIPDHIRAGYTAELKRLYIDKFRTPEKKFANEIEKHFVRMRNRLNDYLADQNLQKALSPDTLNVIKDFFAKYGVEFNAELSKLSLGACIETNDEVIQTMISRSGLQYKLAAEEYFIYSQHINNILGVNNTVYRQVEEAVASNIANMQDIGQLAERINHEFKIAVGRSVTIARTETNSLANDMFDRNMKANDVEEKTWMTSEDELVRELHIPLDGKTISVNGTYSNNLAYPGDHNGPAEQVINCRCFEVAKY
jgi:HK97 family phage portal protein